MTLANYRVRLKADFSHLSPKLKVGAEGWTAQTNPKNFYTKVRFDCGPSHNMRWGDLQLVGSSKSS